MSRPSDALRNVSFLTVNAPPDAAAAEFSISLDSAGDGNLAMIRQTRKAIAAVNMGMRSGRFIVIGVWQLAARAASRGGMRRLGARSPAFIRGFEHRRNHPFHL